MLHLKLAPNQGKDSRFHSRSMRPARSGCYWQAARLLVACESWLKQAPARKSLPAVSNDPNIIGKFHYDFETDSKTWTGILSGSKSKSGIKIIFPDTYGQKGKIIKSLPLDIKADDLKEALLKANETFVKTTEKKN